jgi:hypothetical protein
MAIETAVVLFLISMAGNIYQFCANRKGRDLDAIKKEFELFQQIRSAKDNAYEESMKRKDIQIKQLMDEVNAQQELIRRNSEELKNLNKMVQFLIANGCQEAKSCPDHCPYTTEDIKNVISIQADK